MHRHQRKSGCKGSYHVDGTLGRRSSGYSIVHTANTVTEHDKLIEIFGRLNVNLSKVVKNRYSVDIGARIYSKGIHGITQFVNL
jgi:hypothetical protein